MFNNSKYTRWYLSIIENAKDRKKSHYRYYDRHHILPKCCGGTNDKSNIVVLSRREHFICHLLLPKMVATKNHKIRLLYALNYFKECFTSRMYELYRLNQAVIISKLIWINNGTENKRILPYESDNYFDWVKGRLKIKRKKFMSEESKKAIGDANRGVRTGSKNPAARIISFRGILYSTVKEACIQTNLSRHKIVKEAIYL